MENDIMSLPYEIIAKILSYLPAIDRNNARLVCTSWYNASKDVTILKQHKFICNGLLFEDSSDPESDSGIKIMSDMLETGGYNYINLEFRDTHLNIEFERFLTIHAAKIYSLSFCDCTFSFTAIEHVMLKCSNLKELRFRDSRCISNELRRISKMKQEDIIQKNLTILTFVRNAWISDYVFSIFMNVYPHVKELILDGIRMNCSRLVFQRYYKKLSNDTDSNVEFTSDSVTTFLAFYYTIKRKCKCIEKLGFVNFILDGISDEDLILLASMPCLRLTEAQIHGRMLSPDGIKSFLTKHPNLTAIEMFSVFIDFDCFEFMFSQCPNLEYLKLMFPGENVKWENVMHLLSKSRVKHFEYTSIYWIVLHSEQVHIPLNRNLSHLSISAISDDIRVYTMLLKTFCNLTYLNFDSIQLDKNDGSVASLIFKNQVNLRTLILNGCDWINDSVFEDDCQLKKLERLELNRCYRLTDLGIKKFDFPCLKVLRMDYCENITREGFSALFHSSPLLDHLSLSGTKISDEIFVQMCQSLNFLKRLQILDCGKLDYSNVCNISQFSSSLRFIQITHEDIYFYNYYAKQFLRIKKQKSAIKKYFYYR